MDISCEKRKETTKDQRRLGLMLLMAGGFMTTEFIVGYFGGSLTLVADSFHMLSDVAALSIAIIAITLSSRTWEKSSYGWVRAEVLGALINSVFLLALCFSILIEAIKRFLKPEQIKQPRWIFGVGVAGLIINLIGLCMFKEHGHHHTGNGQNGSQLSHGHSHNKPLKNNADMSVTVDGGAGIQEDDPNGTASQMNIRGVFLHILADAMASVVVIISASAVWATEHLRKEDPTCWKSMDYIDPALSIFICVIICVSAWPLFYNTSMILLQTAPPSINLKDLQIHLEKIRGVQNIYDLQVWQLNGTQTIGSVHITCKDKLEYERISSDATKLFHLYGIQNTTIELNSIESIKKMIEEIEMASKIGGFLPATYNSSQIHPSSTMSN